MAIKIDQLQAPQLAANKPVKRSWNMEIRFGTAKVSLEQRMIFTERLSLLLGTGVSLLEAIKVLHQQTEEPLLAEIMQSLVDTISLGKSFSVALGKYRRDALWHIYQFRCSGFC